MVRKDLLTWHAVSSRSTEDDYTPQSQVEIVQDLVIDTLRDVYGSLNIHYHHLKTHQEAIHS